MKIAICDDNKEELLRIYNMLNEYKERYPAFEIDVSAFSSVNELSKHKLCQYQLFILDILMPGTSGIDFASSLRASANNAAVVFVTSSTDFALEAYAVNAVQYLLKPINKEALFDVLDSVWLTVERKKADSIVVSTQDGIKNFYHHNIVFVECARHLAYFHMSDNTKFCSRTLRQSFVSYIAPLLADERFIHPHHSYCVNKEYVIKLNQRDFEMFGGHIVPIAKERFAEVKSSYLSYLDSKKGG